MDSKNIELDFEKMPRHVAIIMDGNGRWASKRFLPTKAGHKAGAETLEKISNYAAALGIKHLTVYAFSTENWKRSEEEVKGIMDLLRNYLKTYINKAKKDQIKVDVIGDIRRLDLDIQQKIENLEQITANKTGMCLHIALNYGGRDELVRTAKKLMKEAKIGHITEDDLTETVFASYLDTAGIPDPEILIRTSGELRVSNFLLWQIAYSEMIISDRLWPDFSEGDLKQAIFQFQNRDRRFGGRK